MGMAELEQALALVRAHPDLADFVGPRAEQLVAAAESALNLAFPPTYRRFLLELGAGSIRGAEICGVIDDDFEHSSVPDAIWWTLTERSRFGLPPTLIVFCEVGDGVCGAVDTSRADLDGECPVVTWIPGWPQPEDKREILAPDFGSFFFRLAMEILGGG